MAETQSDLLMKFVRGGQSIVAGGTSTLRKDDKLLFDFWAGKFFEIETFSLGLNLIDLDAPQPVPSTPAKAPAHHGPTHQAPAEPAAPPPKAGFARWRDRKKTWDQIKQLTFPTEMEPFSFTRLVDCATPLLFESCTSAASFDTATIVKRKLTGQATLAFQTYLRIDFTDVMVVGLTWNDGTILKETCRFICRGMSVQYKQQAADGSLGAAASSDWTQKMALRGKS